MEYTLQLSQEVCFNHRLCISIHINYICESRMSMHCNKLQFSYVGRHCFYICHMNSKIILSCSWLGLGSYKPAEGSWLLDKGSHRQAQPRAQMKAQQKPPISSVGVSGIAHVHDGPVLASHSQYRPRSYAFNKLPQERTLSRMSRPTQYGSKLRPTLEATQKEYSQHGRLSTQTNLQAPKFLIQHKSTICEKWKWWNH